MTTTTTSVYYHYPSNPPFAKHPGSSILQASTIRIGFWGPLYCNYNKEPPNPVIKLESTELLTLGLFHGGHCMEQCLAEANHHHRS